MSPAPSTTPAPNLSDISTEGKDLEVLPRVMVVTGAPGSGKTTLAATAFADLSEALVTPPEERITLKGAVWLLSDEQGTVSLSARNIAPEYVIDFRDLLSRTNGNADQALTWTNDLIGQAFDAGAHTLVHDTMTTFGALLERWFVYGEGCPESKGGNRDTMKAWGIVGDRQFQVYQTAAMLRMRMILLAHPMANKAEEAANETGATRYDKAKATSNATPGDNYIVPALSGNKIRSVIVPQSCISGWIRADVKNGKRTRTWMPFGGEGSQGKNRYEGILSEEEPADLHAQDKKILDSVGSK